MKALALRWPDWVFGFQDEVWFSRLAQPALRAWAPHSPSQPLRLHHKEKDTQEKDTQEKDTQEKDTQEKDTQEKNTQEKDTQEKNTQEKNTQEKNTQEKNGEALACYGLLRHDTKEMLLRFVQGRPVSAVTTAFLEWLTATLAAQGVRVLVLAWDNASWHRSTEVRAWIQAHNRRLRPLRRTEEAGCHLLVCPLPVKSPWLNAIEPKWVHGKKNIVEPQRKLSACEIQQRLCEYYDCQLLPPLVQ